MNPETTEELLARLEREHVADPKYPELCRECYEQSLFPCETARVVAHARSLGAALLEYDHSYAREWRAALGEAQ